MKTLCFFILLFAASITSFCQTDSDEIGDRGLKKFFKEDYRGAIADFNIAIETYTKSSNISNLVSTYFNRGNAKAKLQDYRGAIADYSKAIEINSANSNNEYLDAYYNRGIVKAKLNDHYGAVLDFTKIIDYEGISYFLIYNPEVYLQRGLSKIKIGHKESGCLDLSKAGELGVGTAYDSIKELCN